MIIDINGNVEKSRPVFCDKCKEPFRIIKFRDEYHTNGEIKKMIECPHCNETYYSYSETLESQELGIQIVAKQEILNHSLVTLEVWEKNKLRKEINTLIVRRKKLLEGVNAAKLRGLNSDKR